VRSAGQLVQGLSRFFPRDRAIGAQPRTSAGWPWGRSSWVPVGIEDRPVIHQRLGRGGRMGRGPRLRIPVRIEDRPGRFPELRKRVAEARDETFGAGMGRLRRWPEIPSSLSVGGTSGKTEKKNPREDCPLALDPSHHCAPFEAAPPGGHHGRHLSRPLFRECLPATLGNPGRR
jgi:hypothetical protein